METTGRAKRGTGPAQLLARVNRLIADRPWSVVLVGLVAMAVSMGLKFLFFPVENFGDALGVLRAVADPSERARYDPSFLRVIDVFAFLTRRLGSMSLEQWCWVLMLPAAAVFAVAARKAPPKTLLPFLLLCGFAWLLPVFVVSVSKDLLQYLIFFLVFLALDYFPWPSVQLGVCCAAFTAVALLLRSYYGIVVLLAALLFALAAVCRRLKKPWQRAALCAGVVAAGVGALFLCERLLPDLTQRVLLSRMTTLLLNRKTAADDKILMDLFSVPGLVPNFLLNYLVNGFRMLLPFELAVRQAADLPLLAFQLLLTGLLAYAFVRDARAGGKNRAAWALIAAFYLTSFLFEPDFGSWLRHEAAAFPLLWFVLGTRREKARDWSDDVLRFD